MWNNLVVPSRLPIGSDFHLFKDGIEPMWEDPHNAQGGKWTHSLLKKALDDSWLNACLSCIGEQYEDNSENICGTVVSVRRADRIALWTRDRNDQSSTLAIGKAFKSHLDVTEETKISWVPHQENTVPKLDL